MARAINIEHASYSRSLRHKSSDSLRYIIRDAREAIDASPTGHKASYYADEINYAAAELRRRGEA